MSVRSRCGRSLPPSRVASILRRTSEGVKAQSGTPQPRIAAVARSLGGQDGAAGSTRSGPTPSCAPDRRGGKRSLAHRRLKCAASNYRWSHTALAAAIGVNGEVGSHAAWPRGGVLARRQPARGTLAEARATPRRDVLATRGGCAPAQGPACERGRPTVGHISADKPLARRRASVVRGHTGIRADARRHLVDDRPRRRRAARGHDRRRALPDTIAPLGAAAEA